MKLTFLYQPVADLGEAVAGFAAPGGNVFYVFDQPDA